MLDVQTQVHGDRILSFFYIYLSPYLDFGSTRQKGGLVNSSRILRALSFARLVGNLA